MANNTPTTIEAPAADTIPPARTKHTHWLVMFADADDRTVAFHKPVAFAEAIGAIPDAVAAVPLPDLATAPVSVLGSGTPTADDPGSQRNAQKAFAGDFIVSPRPTHSDDAIRVLAGRKMPFPGISMTEAAADFHPEPQTTPSPTSPPPSERSPAAPMRNTLTLLERPFIVIFKNSREACVLTIHAANDSAFVELRRHTIDEESGDLRPTEEGILIEDIHVHDVARALLSLLHAA